MPLDAMDLAGFRRFSPRARHRLEIAHSRPS
jgi:hypothetical protein